MRVLIVEDGYGPHPLAAVRAFGRAGWDVGIGSPQHEGRAVSSRWTRRWHRVPGAERGLGPFVEATAAAVVDGKYEVVFGGDDIEVLALTACRGAVRAVVPHAAHDVVRSAIDKVHLTAAAQRAGLATPHTYSVTDVDDVPLPAVVKARLHWSPGAVDVSPRQPPRICHSRADVARAADDVVRSGGEPFLQEVVTGSLAAFTAVVDRTGRLVARVQQRTLRESPQWGNSVRAETVPVDEALAAAVERLLGDLGWFGLANLQFLVSADGTPRLIDLNGRFYGSMALAMAAGVDLPVVWATTAIGGVAPSVPEARVGVRYQALEEDLRRAWAERRRGLVRDVAGCLRFAPGAVHSTWSTDDPLPAVRRGWSTARDAARAARRG